jgi:putative ABC transport system permease protein
MKLIDILKSSNSNLLRSKSRTILTIIAIFVGAFTITLTTGLSAGVNDYIGRQLDSLGGEDIITVQPKPDKPAGSGPQEYDPDATVSASSGMSGNSSGNLIFTEQDRKKIAAVPHVKEVQSVVTPSVAYAEYDNSKKFVFTARGIIEGFRHDILAGQDISSTTQDDEVLIDLQYIQPLGLTDSIDNPEKAIGKTITLASRNPITKQLKTFNVKVAGVLNKSLVSTGGTSIITNHLAKEMLAYNNEGVPKAMQFTGLPMYMVLVDSNLNSNEVNTVKENIESAGKYEAQTMTDMLGSVKSIIDAISWVLLAFGAVALFAAAFGIINTLFMSVSERTREIGLMKAMGMSGGRIFILFSFEAILIGFWGSLLAVFAAIGAGGVINSLANGSFLKDLPGFTLMQYPIQNVIVVMLIIMLIAFLSGALPARRASALNPIDALRYE